MPTIRKLTEKDVTFTLIRHEEDTDPRDLFDVDVDEQSQWIRDQIDSGNEWAWFVAEVKATWNGHSASDFLGGCSYWSEEDFRNCPYFADMKSEALARLNEEIRAEVDSLMPLVDCAVSE